MLIIKIIIYIGYINQNKFIIYLYEFYTLIFFTNILYQIFNKIYYWGFYIINTTGAYLTYYISYYNNKYNIFYYFIIITILLLLFVIIFIKIKLGFWIIYL